MTEEDKIERCAQLCDGMIQELEAQKPKSRKGQYDRRSPRQIDYAIRMAKRLGERIRALKGVTPETAKMVGDGDRLAKAIAIAIELRPIIAQTKDSAWKQTILRQLDDLIG